jgi:hypothetical protein
MYTVEAFLFFAPKNSSARREQLRLTHIYSHTYAYRDCRALPRHPYSTYTLARKNVNRIIYWYIVCTRAERFYWTRSERKSRKFPDAKLGQRWTRRERLFLRGFFLLDSRRVDRERDSEKKKEENLFSTRTNHCTHTLGLFYWRARTAFS